MTRWGLVFACERKNQNDFFWGVGAEKKGFKADDPMVKALSEVAGSAFGDGSSSRFNSWWPWWKWGDDGDEPDSLHSFPRHLRESKWVSIMLEKGETSLTRMVWAKVDALLKAIDAKDDFWPKVSG